MTLIRSLAPWALATLCLPVAHAAGSGGACAANERPLAFTTTEGTFHNVDVSPDGKRIAFDMLGDIYVAPIKGGKAAVLSAGPAWDVRPIWSPDGSQLAFISDRSGRDQVHVMPAQGGAEPRQMGEFPTSGTLDDVVPVMESVIPTAEWMPDGKAVVIDGRRVGEDQPKDAVLASVGAPSGSTYHWNGQALYRFTAIDGPSGDLSYRYGIWRFVPATGTWERIGDTPSVAASIREAPSVSPDGRWLVYRTRSPVAEVSIPGYQPAGETHVDTISARDLRTGEVRILVAPVMSEGWRSNGARRQFAQIGRFTFTPDSRHVVVAYGGGIHKVELRTGKHQRLPLSMDVTQCIAANAAHAVPLEHGPLAIRNLRGTTLRADGRQLAFSALRRLHVMDLPDGTPRVLAPDTAGQFQPAYSPDGKWIAFVTWNETEGGYLWRIPAAGGTPRQLTKRPGHYQTPVWSADGRYLVFVASDDIGAKRGGFSVRVDSGQVHVLTVSDGSLRNLGVNAWLGHPPSFSEEGTRVHYAAFSSTDDVQLRLHSVALDGSDPRDDGLEMSLPASRNTLALPSPDGRLIALLKHGNLHLATCDQAIGRTGFDVEACKQAPITTDGALDPRWSFDGTHLEWSFANTHYRSSTDALKAFVDRVALDPGAVHSADAREVHFTAPRRTGKGSVVLKGARLVTMRGSEVIEKGAVRVDDGRITAVGVDGEVSIPDGATIIDVQGKTVLPGFIDAHAHMTTLPRDLLVANHGEALIYLAFGVTTAKDPSSGGIHGYAYSEQVEAGAMVGPRLLNTEAMVWQTQSIESFEAALGIARRARRLGATFLKYHTGYTREQRRWIINAATAVGLNSATHFAVSNYTPGRLNLSTVLDGAVSSEHGLDDRDHYADVVEFMARSGTWLNFAAISTGGGYPARYWESLKQDPRVQRFHVGSDPRPRATLPEGEPVNGLPPLGDEYEREAKLMARIAAAGGTVTVGSHGDHDGFGFHTEMWSYARGGMGNHAILRAATLNGAHAAGIHADVGSIEVGKIADLVILDKNPLEDIRNTLTVERVMKDGVLRDAKTLDEVWPTRTPLPAWKYKAN